MFGQKSVGENALRPRRGLTARPAVRLLGVVWMAWGLLSVAGLAKIPLKILETDDLRLITYTDLHGFIVPHLAKTFENAMAFYNLFFAYKSKEKVTILLEDFGDYGHGGADSVPRNHISLGIAPFSTTYETMPANERMNWLMNHELVHVVICDKPAGADNFFRKLFLGKVYPRAEDPPSILWTYLANPRRYSPRWFHEGIAVFMETWTSGGLGRLLGGYDEMVFRTLVLENKTIYDPVGLESEGTAIDFQVGVNSYLYGTRFMAWLGGAYGPAKLLRWVDRTPGSKAYFASQFREVYGMSLTEGWRRWVEAEKAWQKANLERIRRYPPTPCTPLATRPLGSMSRPYVDSDGKTVYVGARTLGHPACLAALNLETGKLEALKTLRGAALFYVCSLAFDPVGRTLFYTTDNNAWRDLHRYDVKDGVSKRLVKDFRGGDLAFNRADNSLWAVRHENGATAIARLEAPYTLWLDLAAFPYGQDLFDIDVSPDGRLLTGALADPSGRMKLVGFETAALREGRLEPRVLHDFEFSSPANFVFTPDGKALVGSSYYTGVSNLFRHDLATGKTDVISNAETGLFRPLPLPDGRLAAFRFTADGFLPVLVEKTTPLEDVEAIQYLGQEIVRKYPVVKSWKMPPSAGVDLAQRTVASGDYRPSRSLSWISLYPVVQGYKKTAAAGFRAEFMDHLGLSGLGVDVSASPSSGGRLGESLHVAFDAHHWNWKFSGGYNTADFYDLFGPTKTSRKGYWAKLEHKKNLVYDAPQLLDFEWSAAFYGDMEELPYSQDIPVSHKNFFIGRGALVYSNLEKTLGAVEDEKGCQAKVTAGCTIAGAQFFPGFWGNFDYGFMTPLPNSPVWLRFAGGKAFGDHQDSLGNFYFGSFGNNWVDHRDIGQYRLPTRFPGTEINTIGGSDFARFQVEWCLPPHRFERLGSPWLYCNWVRLSLFSTALLTGVGAWDQGERWFDAGAQLDFRVILFSHLNATLSVGFAGARNTDGKQSKEFMVSLKIL